MSAGGNPTTLLNGEKPERAPQIEAIVIGTSAGALEALSTILPRLPQGFQIPIMIVVHLPADKKSIVAEILRGKCSLSVQEAEDKEQMERGTIYIAPPDYHLLVERDNRLSLSSEEPVYFSRPSIDVLFESAADAFGARLVGIVLTGANEDGARGLRAIQDAGGRAIVQRPESAYASMMPESALAACPGSLAMSLQEIASYLGEVNVPA